MSAPVILLVFVIAGLLAWQESTLLGICFAIGIPALSKLFVSLDPQIYRLAALSLWLKASYDPARRRIR